MYNFRTTSAYGWRTHPITGKRSFHSGIDIVYSHKAPIRAFTAGEVIYSGLGRPGTGLGGFGNVVLIKDSKGRGHLYSHLDSVSVRKGKQVKIGDAIGRQGATGNVTGSHLHYEVRKKTTGSFGWEQNKERSTIDPRQFMKKGGTDRVVKKIKEDGYLGPDTIKRLQQFFNTPVDGKVSKPSMVIKELQKFLNKYGQ